MKDPTSLEWHPGPGAEELARRQAQLHVLSRQLLDRERDLAAYRNELHAFETTYRKALGSRYARLDELAELLEETAEPRDDLGLDDEDGDGPAERYPGQGVPDPVRRVLPAGRGQPRPAVPHVDSHDTLRLSSPSPPAS